MHIDSVIASFIVLTADTVRWWMRSDGYSAEDVSRFFLATTPFR